MGSDRPAACRDSGDSGATLHGRYEIRRTLGEGGMGVVYEAYDRVRATRVALKTMRRLDPGELYRFKNEFRALADVSHPNLAALHEFEAGRVEGEHAFFTMEYIAGVDFLRHVTRNAAATSNAATLGEPVDPIALAAAKASVRAASLGVRVDVEEDVARLRGALAQLVEGVAALHACGKLHRDLKPSNVLVTAEARVVVLDFGLVASLVREGQPALEQAIVGTPEYMSPEQASAAELTEASDWYSVGVMLYEALAGALPFHGPPLTVLMDKQQREPTRPRDRVEGVPDDLDALCMDLLQRDPRKRPDAHEILARLSGTATRAGSSAPSTPRQIVARAMSTLGTAFVGRERHTSALAAAFRATTEGRAVVGYVHGSSGMGKSLLVRRWLDTLVERDEAIVLAGRCYERETVAYNALDSIVDALSEHLRRLTRLEVEALLPIEIHALTRLFPILDRVEAVNAAPRRAHAIPDPQELRRRAATALRELLERIALRRPLVLWIDDLQWGDIDSAALIAELLRPPNPPPVLLVVSFRSEDAASPLVAALRDLHTREGGAVDLREIEVGPLERAEARVLALKLLGDDQPGSQGQATVVADESGGNPFFIDELVRHLTSGQSIRVTTGGEKLRLDEVLFARVMALSDDARHLLETIAVAGHPLARGAAASAAELTGEREVTALALLRTGRLVRSLRKVDQYDVETYHNRIRVTVVAHLDAATRARLHLRVALALVTRGNVDPEALVVHFQEGGDLRKAAEFAAVAAAKAVEALAFDRAAALWRRALDLPEISDDAARDLRWKLGDALANGGRGAEAAEAYLAASRGAAASDHLELHRRAAEQLLHCGRIAEGIRALREVLAAVDMKLPAAPWTILISLVLAELLLRVRGVRFQQRDASQVPATELTRVDICWAVGASLAVVTPVVARYFQTRHLLLALRAGEPTRIARGLSLKAGSMAFAGVPAHDRAQSLIRSARTLADRLHDPYSSAWVIGADGITAYLEGRFRRALTSSDESSEQLRDRCTGALWEVASLVMFSSQAAFHLGELAELSRRMPVITQDARQRGDLYLLTNVRIGWMNAVWLAADDTERAERELDDAMAQWGSPEQQLQQYYELVARVQIALYRGRGAGALAQIGERWRRLERAHLFRVQTVRVFVRHLRARAALAALAAGETVGGDADVQVRSVTRDARAIARERLPWGTPLARLLEAAVAARRGARDEAATLLATATVEFEASDMALWAAAARRRHGELVAGTTGTTLVAQADVAFRAQLVKDPERFCAMLAPGFEAARE